MTRIAAAKEAGEENAAPQARRRLRGLYAPIPLAFLGLGVYRAWIEITFVGSFVNFPAFSLSTRDLFDFSAVAEMVLFVLLARRIGPLCTKRWPFALCATAMLASTVLLFASFFAPGLAGSLGVVTSVAGGVGLGLIILIWSELYGCLNPIRVTLYYAASLVVGALIIYLYMGLKMPWLFVMTALLPIVSLASACKGFALLPEGERPQRAWVSISVPWKIILLMGFFAFSYGIVEANAYQGYFGPHSSPGTFAVSGVVLLGVLVKRDKFDFNTLCRIALPLTVVALFLISVLGFTDDYLSGFCVAGGYTAFSILIMVLCSNLCYRRASRFLFGVELSLDATKFTCAVTKVATRPSASRAFHPCVSYSGKNTASTAFCSAAGRFSMRLPTTMSAPATTMPMTIWCRPNALKPTAMHAQ